MPIAASLILLALAVLAYRRVLRPSGSIGLLALRLVVLLLLAGILGGAVISRTWLEKPRRIAVLVDRSASLAAAGLDSTAIRVAGLLPTGRLPRSYWVFADSAIPTSSPATPARDSGRTRIAAALGSVGKTKPGAVVLVSDGQDNGESDPVAAAKRLNVPVYTIGFGRGVARNTGIVAIVVQPAVHAGETTEVAVRVHSQGFDREQGRVRLAGQARQVALGSDASDDEISFRMVFDKPGYQELAAAVDSMPLESEYADNRTSVGVAVRPGRYRVAYVSNRPGPGTRFIRDALASDKRLELVVMDAASGRISVPAGGVGSVRAFVLDDVAETADDRVLWQGIVDDVESGAGLLVVAGPGFQTGPVLSRVLPGAMSGPVAGEFVPEVTKEGGVLPWLSTDRGDSVAADLSTVPPFSGIRRLTGEAGQLTWLRSSKSGDPLVVSGPVGRGTVVIVAGYPLWRWGFLSGAQPGEPTQLQSFLAGTVRYLLEQGTNRFTLEPAKPLFLSGEQARLVLKAVGPDGSPWTGLSASVRVRHEPGDTVRGAVRLQEFPMTETGSGVYEAAIPVSGPGRYTATASVRLRDSTVGEAAGQLLVAEQSIEMARIGLDSRLLRQIAQTSAGRYFYYDSLPKADPEFETGTYKRGVTLDFRRQAWAYALVAVLAGLEWTLRRRKGLL